MSNATSIPPEKAMELCREYRDKHKVRLFNQCWGCLRFSKEEPGKMCFHNPPENRGCKFINELFDESKLKLPPKHSSSLTKVGWNKVSSLD